MNNDDFVPCSHDRVLNYDKVVAVPDFSNGSIINALKSYKIKEVFIYSLCFVKKS